MDTLSLSAFSEQLNSVMQILMKEFARRQVNELYKGKITLPQFFVLDYLYLHGETKMKDLASCMEVTTAAMTGSVERLVRDKLVVRVAQPHDRRIIKVRLTGPGSELVKRVHDQKRRMVINIFGKIPERDRQHYLRILMQIKDVLIREPR